jgi:hypothetical protein
MHEEICYIASGFEGRQLTFPSYEFILYSCAVPLSTPGKSLAFQGCCVDKAPVMLQTAEDLLQRHLPLAGHP